MADLTTEPLDQRRRLRPRLGKPLVDAGAERAGEGIHLRDGGTSLLGHASIAPKERSRECNDFVPIRENSRRARRAAASARRRNGGRSRRPGPLLRLRHLDEPAQRVREPHLRDRAAVHLEQARRAHEIGEAPRARDRDVQPVAREQELEAARDVLAARARQRVEDDLRLLALELVDRPDAARPQGAPRVVRSPARCTATTTMISRAGTPRTAAAARPPRARPRPPRPTPDGCRRGRPPHSAAPSRAASSAPRRLRPAPAAPRRTPRRCSRRRPGAGGRCAPGRPRGPAGSSQRRRSGGAAPTRRSRAGACPGSPGRAAAGRRPARRSARRCPSRARRRARPGRPRRRRGSRASRRARRVRRARRCRRQGRTPAHSEAFSTLSTWRLS